MYIYGTYISVIVFEETLAAFFFKFGQQETARFRLTHTRKKYCRKQFSITL